MNGWLTFISALGIIGVQTAFIADLANLVGCCFEVPDAVTAITIGKKFLLGDVVKRLRSVLEVTVRQSYFIPWSCLI